MTHTGGSKKRHPGPRALSSRLPGPPAPLSTPSLAPAPARAAPGLTAWPLALDACTFPLRVAASASALGKVHPTPTPPGPLRPRGRPPHPHGRVRAPPGTVGEHKLLSGSKSRGAGPEQKILPPFQPSAGLP